MAPDRDELDPEPIAVALAGDPGELDEFSEPIDVAQTGELEKWSGPPEAPRNRHGRVPKAARSGRERGLHLLCAVAAGLGVAGFVGQWWAVPIGVGVGFGVLRVLRAQEPADVRDARKRAVADLPLGADLLAAALRAGAPVDRAVSAVAEVLGGPLGERLDRVARSLRLGAEPDEAWRHLSDVAGGGRLVSAAVRSSSSGGALAGAFTRLADDLRSDRTAAVEAAARRAGVLIVLPLGTCFLPAFFLAGLVPVVVAVVGDMV
jgi:Flp pilus assembly protein TadB